MKEENGGFNPPTRRDFVTVYIGTKKVRHSGPSRIVYIENSWPFDYGDVVEFSIRDVRDPASKIVATKKVSKSGGSKAIYINRMWGFTVGQMVTFTLRKIGTISDDPRIDSEEGDEEVPPE